MKQPEQREYWSIRYGADGKKETIALIVGKKPIGNAENWRDNDFKCRSQHNKKVNISGKCFYSMLYKESVEEFKKLKPMTKSMARISMGESVDMT